MIKILLVPLLALYILIAQAPARAATPEIKGPDMSIIDNNIIVNLSLHNIDELETTIKSGIGKEIVFTVELLREWNFWPDEFVVSKEIEKIIEYDNLREHYLAVSDNGVRRVEKHFDDYDKMKDWFFSVETVNLANIRELDTGRYYIRIIVESKSLEQLPLIGVLMHFIPEVEMSLAKESGKFLVEVVNEKP